MARAESARGQRMNPFRGRPIARHPRPPARASAALPRPSPLPPPLFPLALPGAVPGRPARPRPRPRTRLSSSPLRTCPCARTRVGGEERRTRAFLDVVRRVPRSVHKEGPGLSSLADERGHSRAGWRSTDGPRVPTGAPAGRRRARARAPRSPLCRPRPPGTRARGCVVLLYSTREGWACAPFSSLFQNTTLDAVSSGRPPPLAPPPLSPLLFPSVCFVLRQALSGGGPRRVSAASEEKRANDSAGKGREARAATAGGTAAGTSTRFYKQV